MDRLQLSGAVRILQVIGMRDVLARIDSRGADQDAPSISRPPQVALIQYDVVAPRLHRVFVTIFDEVGISVHDSQNLDAVLAERGGGRRDHCVGRRRGPAGKQNGNATDRTRRIAPISKWTQTKMACADSRSFERMKDEG